jgi:hypothetical protein
VLTPLCFLALLQAINPGVVRSTLLQGGGYAIQGVRGKHVSEGHFSQFLIFQKVMPNGGAGICMKHKLGLSNGIVDSSGGCRLILFLEAFGFHLHSRKSEKFEKSNSDLLCRSFVILNYLVRTF